MTYGGQMHFKKNGKIHGRTCWEGCGESGVYGWFFRDDEDKCRCLYIGKAGQQVNSDRTTISRALLVMGYPPISVDSGKQLDTDFILHVCIYHLLEKNKDCYWKHIDDDPYKEREMAKKFKPILQDETPNLHGRLKPSPKPKGYWNAKDVAENQRKEKRKERRVEGATYVNGKFEKLLKEDANKEKKPIINENYCS